jgi:undecaprenyl-diphosphatase
MGKIKKIFDTDLKNSFYLALFCLICFTWLGYQVLRKELDQFDNYFIDLLPTILPKNFIYFAKLFYFLGNAEVSATVVFFTLVILAWKRKWLEAKIIAVSSLGVLLLMDLVMKPFFYRRRPLGRLVHVDGRSFPSGHATGNVLLYFLLVYIISVQFPKFRIYLYLFSTMLLLLMGISSIYLRVHWLTDILGGYCLGYILFTISLIFLKISDQKYIVMDNKVNK